MTTDTNLLTLSDYAALDEPENEYVTELVRGTIVREPRPGRPHGRIQVRLAHHLERWARAHGAEVTVESGYVLADPEAHTVLVHRPDGSANLLREPDALEGEEVLPGFALELAELFRTT